MSKEILERVIQRIPYPNHISGIDDYGSEVRFTWRGDRFKVDSEFGVSTLENHDGLHVESGSNLSILLEKILEG